MRSTFSVLGIPEALAIGLELVALSLSLIPYFGGADLGSIKIPKLSPQKASRLRFVGPFLPIIGLLLFLPLWPQDNPFKDAGNYMVAFFKGGDPKPAGSLIPLDEFTADEFKVLFGKSKWSGGLHWGVITFDEDGRTGRYTNEGGGGAGRVLLQTHGGTAPLLLGEWLQGDGQAGALIIEVESSQKLMSGPIAVRWGPGFSQTSQWNRLNTPSH